MAIRSGFFNSVDGDRKYNAAFFAEYFASFIANGVFPNPSTNLQVIEGTNMTTIVKPGKGWINGYYIHNDSDHVLEHDIADGILKRIDRVVMRLNYQSRQIEIVIKKGTNASNPVPPTLQRDLDVYELALADVLINNGATQITQANITDQRLNKDLCGIVHGTVEQVDTTTLFNQYQSWINQQKQLYENDFENWSDDKRQEFDDWMNLEQTDFQSWKVLEQSEFEAWVQTIKDILNENAAGNLQLQIDDHKADDVNHVKYAVDTGTANAKVVSIIPAPESYVDGMAIAFKNAVKNTGPTTIDVNGLGEVPIVKSNGQPLTPDYLLPNSIYTVRYNATTGNFIFQGEGGGLYGNVTPDDVLAGVIFGTDEGEKIGSMPNNGAVNITPGQTDQVIPYGFHNGQGKVPRVQFDASKVLNDTTIAGKKGTMPNRGAMVITPSTVNQQIPNGFHNGNGYVIGDTDLKPPNIIKGVNIFGVVGTATPKSLGGLNYQKGTATRSTEQLEFSHGSGSNKKSSYYIEVSGLDFLPLYISILDGYSITFYDYEHFSGFFFRASYANELDVWRLSSPAYVTNGGFLLPVSSRGNHNWVAIG